MGIFRIIWIIKIKADQIRDTLTGLYNYDGFIKQLKRLQSDKSNSKGNDKKPGIMTIDVCGMKQINEVYGRENGEKVIMALARILQNSINDDEICCRMCNDEFLVALYDDEKLTRINTLAEEVGNNISKYRIESDNDYVVQIHHAGLVGDKEQTGEIEAHINKAISIKNHKKSAMEQSGRLCVDKKTEREKCRRTRRRHYQSVEASKKTGSPPHNNL